MAEKPTYEALEEKILQQEVKLRQHDALEDDLQYRIAFDRLIIEISRKFINLPAKQIDQGIDHAISAIGKLVGVDRVYLFLHRTGQEIMDNTHEWCGRGITSHLERLKNIPFNSSVYLLGYINAGKVLHIPRVEDLPEKAAALRKEAEMEGTKSMLMVPIKYGDAVIGFLGLDSVRAAKVWSEDVINLLQITAEILANAIERQRSAEALEKSEEKYRTILETMEDGYWETDLAGHLTFVNPAMKRISERPAHEMIGGHSLADSDDETGKRMTKIFAQIHQTGKPVRLTDFSITTPNGKRKDIEISASLMIDDEGNPMGFKGISRDVTVRKKAQQALRESEERYRAVLQANPDPVSVANLKGEILYLNPSFETVFGWTLREYEGKRLMGFIPEDKQAEVVEMMGRVVGGEVYYGLESLRISVSGERIPVSVSGAAFQDVNGKPVGGITTYRDIREKKRMEAQLFNAQKFESIGTLAGGIAHDFNNLLMGIQGNVSLALYDLPPDHPHYDIFVNIEKNIKSGARLTSQLLGYARKGRYEVKPLDLNRLAGDICDTFARTRKAIVITRKFSDGLSPVEADEGQVEQVLLNLLVNSSQAMPKGGRIDIETENATHDDIDNIGFAVKPGKYVCIRISDTGAGMNEETVKHIFEPFFTTKEMGRGTGLGLASSYGIIKGHGGYVTVHSSPGQGASFSVYLPVTVKNVVEKAPNVEAAVKGIETILFVDDEEIVLDVGTRIIEKLGYKVIPCASAKEAVSLYRKNRSDIQMVILDIIMPEMSGDEVFDKLKEINPDVKVLLSSGYSIDGQARGILDKGCDGFIQKPFSIGELSEKIRKIMDT